jgi:hypothetical protein
VRALAPVVLAVVVAACAPTAPEPGRPTTVARVCDQPDGSRVRLTGYLRYRRGMMSFCSTLNGHQTCDLALYEGAATPPDFDIMAPPAGPEAPNAKLSVSVGGEPGQVDAIPRRFTAEDVQMHLDGGTRVSDGGHVVIDGKLSVIPQAPGQPPGPRQCFVTVDWAKPAA